MRQHSKEFRIRLWSGLAAAFSTILLGTAGCGVTMTSAGSSGNTTNGNGTSAGQADSGSNQQMDKDAGLASWAGKGSIALIYTKAESQSLNGGELYTVIGNSASEEPNKYFVASHAVSAKFAPDGKWLAVVTREAPAATPTNKSNSDIQPVETLWLMSADGLYKQRLAAGEFIAGTWLSNPGDSKSQQDTYIYGKNPAYSVQPGKEPVRLSIQLPKNAAIEQYESSGEANKVAIVTTEQTPGRDITERYDSIDLLNPATGAVHVLKKGQPSDGFILGPWLSNDVLFYWPDSLHSASLLADGSQLSTISTNGKVQKITTTLARDSTSTNGFGKAAIQVGAGRALLTSKGVGVWDGQTLELLPHADKSVAIWPAIDGSGKLVAYAQSPELRGSTTTAQTNAWWQNLQLEIYNEGTHRSTVLAAAGSGVIQPHFDRAGDAIVYLKNNSLNWIRSDGTGIAHSVIVSPGTAWRLYPQEISPASISLDIADYCP